MSSLIQQLLNRVLSSSGFTRRLDELEDKVRELEHLVDENDSLWQMLDEHREMDKLFVGTPEEFEEEFTDMMLRNMKPRGDA